MLTIINKFSAYWCVISFILLIILILLDIFNIMSLDLSIGSSHYYIWSLITTFCMIHISYNSEEAASYV